MKIIRILLVFLLIFAAGPNTIFAEAVANKNNSQASYTYNKDQLEALKYLNQVRTKLGLSPVKLNPYLTKAAMSHAQYINLNNSSNGGLSAHRQTPGKKGFTGVTPTDRVKAAGGGISAGEVLSFGKSSSIDAIDSWLDTAYHRSPLINPNTTEIGVGLYKGNAVINMASSGDNEKEQIAIFPYDQMKDVGIGFYGREIPDPLEQFQLEKSGYIISFDPNFMVVDVTATLKDSKGNQIPLLVEDAGEIYFFPTYELAYDEKYTMEVVYSKWNETKRHSKKWSFTTKKLRTTDFTDVTSGVKVNNKHIGYVPIIEQNNLKYLSSGDLLKHFNYEVEVDKKTKSITLTSQTNSIIMQAGSVKATKNKKSIALKNRPIYEDGEVFIPFSIIKDLFGISIQFDKKKNVISLSGKVQPMKDPMLKYSTVNREKVAKIEGYLTKSLANTGYRFESLNLETDKSRVDYKIFNSSNVVVADITQSNNDDGDDELYITMTDSMTPFIDEKLVNALHQLIGYTTKTTAHQFAARVQKNFDNPPADSELPWITWEENKHTKVVMNYYYPMDSVTQDKKEWSIKIDIFAKF